MSEVKRELWGKAPDPAKKKRASPTAPPRVFGTLLLGLLPALALHFLMGWLGINVVAKAEASASDIAAARWNITLITAIASEAAAITFFLVAPSVSSRTGRVLRVATAFLYAGAVLAVGIYLITSILLPGSSYGERSILPALTVVLAGIFAAFSPVIPLWRVNVPDGEVWMILDRNDHLLTYVGPGVHVIQPIQGFEPYLERGPIVIDIDDDSYVSSDFFPYRVRANIVCLFNPLRADRELWVTLRNMRKATLENSLKTEIEYIIRHQLACYGREEMKLDQVLNTIVQDIKEAVDKRKNLGITLAPTNPINIILDPPELVVDTRQRRMSMEALALAGEKMKAEPLNRLLQLAALQGELKMDVSDQGQINFALTPGHNIEIGRGLEQAIVNLARLLRGLPPLTLSAPQALLPNLSAPMGQDDQDTQPVAVPEPPDFDRQAEQTEQDSAASATQEQPDVIDTDVDTQGVYVPRNPIGPKPKPGPKKS
ncbi:MAG: hypothetical protein Kow0063_02830 [Anaerolineae bacterium]